MDSNLQLSTLIGHQYWTPRKMEIEEELDALTLQIDEVRPHLGVGRRQKIIFANGCEELRFSVSGV